MRDLVPITLFISMFGMIFGVAYIRSRENMAMLEKGLNPRTGADGSRKFANLKYGLLLIGAGLGLLVAYLIDTHMTQKATDPSDNPALYFALVAIGGGLGLTCSYLIERKQGDNA